MTARITQSAQGTADAAGTARAIINGPTTVGTVWQIVGVTVQSTSVVRCTARVYRNVESAGALIASARDGRLDTAETNSGDVMRSGEQLVVVWSGCDVGSVCTVNVDVEPR